jgi:predicted DNA-binding transcriptional regulator AlpA
MSDELLTIDDIAAKLDAARRTVAEKWIHEPGFPAPVMAFSVRKRKWRAQEVIAWAAQAAPRRSRPTPGSTNLGASEDSCAR